LTVIVEDYFHVAPLKSVVQTEQWYRFERRVEENTHKALELLESFDIEATFYVLGSIADEMPELVREIADHGHEIASKGYIHRSLRHFSSPSEFRDDLVRSREALEKASGLSVHGYRIGHRWFSPEDLWALDILVEEGFKYDSSVRPLFRRFSRQPSKRVPHIHAYRDGEIWEFPLPSMTIAGWSLPIAGGNYLRQFPHWFMRRAVGDWIRKHDAPFLMYFHVWELDPDQPRIQAAPLRERIRQYRNLDTMQDRIRFYLNRYPFTGIARHLGLSSSRTAEKRELDSKVVFDTRSDEPSDGALSLPESERTAISIVVPCYNEELILPYLANTLASVERKLSGTYRLHFVFVDDGSDDRTWSSLQSIFGGHTNVQLVRHSQNRGVAAAIMTGLTEARTEIVCSIDCDCTYDPHQLKRLIPLLSDGVDMVTASPYHPQGTVRNVPSWRLFLSKSLSGMYRVVLHHSLATYTSCFRVYRRSAMVDLDVREGGFLGVAEMLGALDLQGGSIMECPAVLEVRLLGRSKMKTLKTIVGHLGLLRRLSIDRLLGRRASLGAVKDADRPT
jgi:polysaccharide deacetylase family protein (PEP-CTERM system associated)